MASIRSLVVRALVDEAGKSHNCQRNAAHRITQGQSRLKVRSGRSWDHYCMECARVIVEKDVQKLDALRLLLSERS